MEVLDAAGWPSELIVCDNNSTDRTPEIARDAGAQVVFEPLNQISRARNAGTALASGDWLMFVDADSHPSRALFADALRVLEDGRCIAGGSTLCFDLPDPTMAGMAWIWNTISRCTRWAAGSFMFCEAAAFTEVGGFSHELYATFDFIPVVWLLRRVPRSAGHAAPPAAGVHATTPWNVTKTSSRYQVSPSRPRRRRNFRA